MVHTCTHKKDRNLGFLLSYTSLTAHLLHWCPIEDRPHKCSENAFPPVTATPERQNGSRGHARRACHGMLMKWRHEPFATWNKQTTHVLQHSQTVSGNSDPQATSTWIILRNCRQLVKTTTRMHLCCSRNWLVVIVVGLLAPYHCTGYSIMFPTTRFPTRMNREH